MTIRLALPLTLLAAAGPVLAKSPQDQMFPSDSSCYTRTYTRAHMADHPQQRVTRIAIGPWAAGLDDPRYLPVRVAITLRGSPERFGAVAYCENEAGHLFCQLEGDAGSFTLEPRPNGALRLKVSRRGMMFEGNQDFIEISGTSGDDRVFLLPAGGADACP